MVCSGILSTAYDGLGDAGFLKTSAGGVGGESAYFQHWVAIKIKNVNWDNFTANPKKKNFHSLVLLFVLKLD